ncbi:MAG: hypothetical protein P1P90_00095 [Patescibacteria group bacterium]|nr:hypothetical protein [Patescibacteria group bacterium]
MLNLIIRAIVCIKPSGTVSVLSILFAMMMIFVPKSAFALDALDCITHVENVTLDDVRYLRITRADRKECDLYMIAKNFPQLGEDGKPLPIRQQLRSIQAANDLFVKGKRGVRPVHSHCVPDSKPPADQTMIEREMCADQLVNYYPVTEQILVPRVPQLSESEQIQNLSSETCEALSNVSNPSDGVKAILTKCQKHFAGITIPSPSVSPEREQLTQARAEVASLLATTTEQSQNITAQKAQILSLSASKRSWTGMAVFFLCAFGLAAAVAIHSRSRQNKLQDLANIRTIEMEKRIAEAIEERAGGPTKEDHSTLQQQNVELQERLQEVTHEKTNLSQQLADSRQESESKGAEFAAVKDSLYMQVAKLGTKRDELAQKVQASNKKLEEVQIRHDVLVKEHVDLKTSNDALLMQLSVLYDTERNVRGTHINNLYHSIDLARQVISQLDERYRLAVASNEEKKAEMHVERLNALQQILATTVGEYEARSLALQRLEENDPRIANPENFLRVLTHDAENRPDNLASVVQTNLTLGKLSDQLASDKAEALEQLAQARAENAELQELWRQLVTGIARGLSFDLKALNQLSCKEQSEQLALSIGELKAQRIAESDLQERIAELQGRLDSVMQHNAALRNAMSNEPNRKTIATLEHTAIAAEAEKEAMGRRIDKLRDELKCEREAKSRLHEAVHAKHGAGVFALEATELVKFPTQTLMHTLQVCMLAVHQQPNAVHDAEFVLATDADVGALNSFLHLPLVSENGFRLPPKLRTNMGPLQVYHVADEACRVAPQEAVRVPSVTPTMAPPAMSAPPADLRQQTMLGLGAVSDRSRTVPYPPKTPEFDLTRDPDDEGKPTH